MQKRDHSRRWRRHHIWASFGGLALAASIVGGAPGAAGALSQSRSTPSQTITTLATYHTDLQRDGFDSTETISKSQAAGLHSLWTEDAGASISDEAAVVDGVAYWGDWNGVEHATASNGVDLWDTNLGQTTDSNCNPVTVGVASSATVGTVNGTDMLWTGTGNGQVAELNATTGAIAWETRVAPSTGGFEWSSPALYNGDVYIGVSSYGDCPLVRGAVVQLNAETGAIVNTAYLAPSGCVGAGAWASPAINSSTGSLFIATGNPACTDPLGEAIVELDASTMTVEASWQIPPSKNVSDGDIGATPTLFTATIEGVSTPMVGVAGKNGIFYALKQSDVAAGPVWKRRIAQGGSCPQCDQGSISPAGFNGKFLYVAGGATTIHGVSCDAGLYALNPATGAVKWEDCLSGGGPDLSPISLTPGLVFVTDGSQIVCVSAGKGTKIWSFTDPTNGQFWGGPVVTDDVLYAGNFDGNMYAFATGT